MRFSKFTMGSVNYELCMHINICKSVTNTDTNNIIIINTAKYKYMYLTASLLRV